MNNNAKERGVEFHKKKKNGCFKHMKMKRVIYIFLDCNIQLELNLIFMKEQLNVTTVIISLRDIV